MFTLILFMTICIAGSNLGFRWAHKRFEHAVRTSNEQKKAHKMRANLEA